MKNPIKSTQSTPSRAGLLSGIMAIFLGGACCQAAEILKYEMGQATPQVEDPVNTAAGGALTKAAGLNLFELTSAIAYPTQPSLAITFNAATANLTAALANDSYFTFTLTVGSGVTELDLSSLTFNAARGGGATPRGYAVYVTTPTTADEQVKAATDLTTQRTNWGPLQEISLSGFASLQNLTAGQIVTFKIPVYSPAATNSLDFDNITVNGTVDGATEVPAPTGLVATAGISQVGLTWNPVAVATSYNIKRSETTGGTYTDISTPGAVTTTSYTDNTGTNGTTYYYVVSAVGAGGLESLNSGEVSATPYATLQPAAKILYLSSSNSPVYQTFATSGQFSNNTWIHKALGTADDQIGGDLDVVRNFDGNPMTVKDFLQSFDLVVIGVPTSSGQFVDGANGADWAGITKPILFHSGFAARSLGGRPGLFSGDNTITFTHGNPSDSARESTSLLSDAILDGVTDDTNLYTLNQSDTISGAVQIPNAFGNGEQITSLTDNASSVFHRGVVFWAAGATLNVLPPAGLVVASNRAFLPLKADLNDLTIDGQKVLANLLIQLKVTQAVPPALLTIPTGLSATSVGGQVELAWTESIGAATYTIKRSTTAGTGYLPISTGTVTGATFTDTTVTTGNTYYYVVSAVSAAPAESADSNEAMVEVVAATSPYGDWAAANITAFQPLAPAAFDADAENDGLSNGLEWILGGNPLASDLASTLPSVTGDSTSGLTLVFNRLAGSIDSTTLTVEWGTNLAGFPNSLLVGTSSVAPSGDNPTIDIDVPSTGKVTVRIPAANAAEGKVFARIKAQLNP